MSKTVVDLSGSVIGKLQVVARLGRFNGKSHYICQCACGNISTIKHDNLLNNRTRSCGCLKKGHHIHGLSGTTVHTMYQSARGRARKFGVPFNIELSDIIIPKYCPVLGIPVIVSKKKSSYNSPSLDRIHPERGYVKGNVQVISHRANTLKSNGTAVEHRLVATYIEGFNDGGKRTTNQSDCGIEQTGS